MLMIAAILSLITIISACSPDSSAPVDRQPPKQNAIEPKEVNSAVLTVEAVVKKAETGMTLGSPFNVNDSEMETVKAELGEPDQVDQVGKGYYATYNQYKVVFGFNEAEEIFDIRSYEEKLSKITQEILEKTIGKPAQVKNVNKEAIYIYKIAPTIELKFIIPDDSKGVDHVSVINLDRIAGNNGGKGGTKNPEYTLDIKGQSNKLTTSAWEKMLHWRQQIVAFSKTQDHVYMNGPNKKMVALTFDDGPDRTITPAIIDILDRNQVKGNFFFLGSEVTKYPDIVKNAFDKGHLVLSHSYNHVQLPKISSEAMAQEISQAGEAIKSVIGKEPALLRPPYGDANEPVATMAKNQGYSIVLWSIDTLDWSQKEPENIVKNVTDHVRNGDIILMHSNSDKIATKEALPMMIEALQRLNFEIVDLETLLNLKAYQ